MGALSIREFNSNVSKALARVAAGETVEIMRNGKVFAEIRPKVAKRSDDPEWREKMTRLQGLMKKGVPMGGRASYEDRTE